MMIKIITINKLERIQIADQRAQFTWHITDEKSQLRKVHAHIDFTPNQDIEHYRAFYVREIPLVEALMQYKEGNTFRIDFTEFNKQHCYDKRPIYNAEQQESFSAADLSHLFANAGFEHTSQPAKNDKLENHSFI